MISQKSYKKRLLVLAAIWIILLIVSFSFLSFLQATFAQNPQVQTETNTTWAGYVAATDYSFPTADFTGVNGSWIVPTVNVSTLGYSSAWVGIGGKFDKTLIQAGTQQECVPGKSGNRAQYFAWYELIPDRAIIIDSLVISAGDKITVNIKLVSSSKNTWNINIKDDSTGKAFNINVNYDSSRLSAEWILERPFINDHVGALGDFGKVTFTGCYAKTSKVGSISDFQYSQIKMNDNLNNPLVQISSVKSKTSFTVTYVTPK
jgi:hypothetical protein